MPFYSPLRYPGGKRKLGPLIAAVIARNGLDDSTYIEPYAGGAGVAMHLLMNGPVPLVWINDADPRIAAFWLAVKHNSGELCDRIARTKVTVSEWHRQRAVQQSSRVRRIDLAFSTFYLNRTSRSGVLQGGVVGGQRQEGRWKLDARYNKSELIHRIQAIARHRDRLRVTGLDAGELLASIQGATAAFVFLDPPYFHKRDRRLYRNEYEPEDHEEIASQLSTMSPRWLLTYDNCEEVRDLYQGMRFRNFRLCYTAGEKRLGRELLIAPAGLKVPRVAIPAAVRAP